MTTTNLDTLPVELISIISTHLDLTSTKSLRLTNKHLSRTTFPFFRSVYLIRRTLSLSVSSLKSFIHDLQYDSRALNVTEIVLHGENSQEFPPRVIHLLGRMFLLVRELGRVVSLVLEVGKDGMGLVLLAMGAVALPLRRFAIHPRGGGETVAVDAYTGIDALASALGGVREFTWSLSSSTDELEYGEWDEDVDEDPRVRAENDRSATVGYQNIARIRNMLALMPGLEKLDLLWYKSFPRRCPEANFFDYCFDSILAFRNLRSCTLRGLYVSQNDLSVFLTKTTATEIVLREVHLRSGSWVPILRIITGGECSRIDLEDLFELRDRLYQIVFFDVLGRSRFCIRAGCCRPKFVSQIDDSAARVLINMSCLDRSTEAALDVSRTASETSICDESGDTRSLSSKDQIRLANVW